MSSSSVSRSTNNGTKVVVAMSGGVDSSVAALLLHRQGYDVVGVTMRLSTVEDPTAPPAQRRCCTAEDVDDSRDAASAIGIPHHVVNFEREFKSKVIEYFVAEYKRGRTPHPCIACNEHVKFDPLMERAKALNARYLATGHYARVDERNGHYALLKAVDPSKDQSYVLFNLGQDELSRTLFPNGGFTKAEIRRIAHEARLPNADKPDSQEICFIPHGDYRDYLRKRIEPTPGRIVDTAGNDLGPHQGMAFFTVGQRKALGVQRSSPTYVVAIQPETATVVVGDKDDVNSDELHAEKVTYTSGVVPDAPIRVTAKVRYKASEAAAILCPGGDRAKLRFDQPQRALTPGQAAVFYVGDEVLGGGIIDRVALPALHG